MVVAWMGKAGDAESDVLWKPIGEEGWRRVKGWVREVHETDVWVHLGEIEGLKPESVYEFRIGRDGEVHRFKTLCQKLGQVRFSVGGDAYYREKLFREMNQTMVRQGIDFAVVGGDIAYTIGEKKFEAGRQRQIERWAEFFRLWKADFVGSDGVMVPMVPVVGNHDVPRGRPDSDGVMFYDLFPLKEVAYRTMDVGGFLSLFLLDTGHTSPVGGKQAAWLENAFKEREAVAYKIPIYHIAAYPSFYKFEGQIPTQIRKYWVPLFERFGVKVAFENHNHAYKRTHPINGVVYLGDGSWGVPPRKMEASRAYLARAASLNSCFIVTVDAEGCKIEPLGIDGKPIDEVVVLK